MMDPEVHEDLSRAYRSLQTPGSSACPEASRLVALALQEVRGDERVPLAEHVVACARCAKDYRILLDTHQDAARELRSVDAPRRMSAWRLAALAAGLVAVAVGLVQLRPPGSPTQGGALRGVGLEGKAPVSPPQESMLSGAPERFAWPAVPGTTRYQLTLFDAEGRPVFRSGPVAGTHVDLPASLRDALRDQRYFWVVVAERDGAGERLGPYWFRISASGAPAR